MVILNILPLPQVRKKTKAEKEAEEADYRRWLADPTVDKLGDEALEKDLSGLKKMWTDDRLPEDERFLRDYILNQRYREKDDGEFPTYEEIVGDDDDEEEIEKQEEFECKYDFRLVISKL
jgi:protein KRI1